MSAATETVAPEATRENDEHPVVLKVSGISKSFGGTRALDDVSIDILPGEVHAIVGENGAGKSTLVKILSGFYPSGTYEGSLLLDGQPLQIDSIHGAERSGVFLVPQDLQTVPDMSIAENLYLNREPKRFGFVLRSEMLPGAAERLREFGFSTDPSRRMGDLRAGEQQLVLIARAMMQGLKVIAVDEPTASLTDAEAAVLFRHIENLRRNGIAVIYISHRLDEIARIANRVTVLRDGRVADRIETKAGKLDSERIVHAMVGRNVVLKRRDPTPYGDVLLSVAGLGVEGKTGGRRRRVDAVDFEVRAGEVLGIFGSVGCGADELVDALFGMSDYSPEDAIRIRGSAVPMRSPRDAISAGVGYLPGHRQRDALFPLLPVGQNITMLALGQVTRNGFVDPDLEANMVHDFYSRFRIKAQSVDIPISTLSGGNQQKAMLARILARDPDILILHEPTQGVDIATKQDVYALVDTLAQAGKAVIIASSDLEEIMMASDRILVLRQGQSIGIHEHAATSQHEILAIATGGNEPQKGMVGT